jgi:hypothetical protein
LAALLTGLAVATALLTSLMTAAALLAAALPTTARLATLTRLLVVLIRFSAAALLATLVWIVCLVHLFAPFICSFASRINKTFRHS